MKKTNAAVVVPVTETVETPQVSRRILVVDDEPSILAAYKDILQPQNNVIQIKSSRSANKNKSTTQASSHFEVVAVTNGEEAVKAVKQSLRENRPFAMGFFDVILGTGIDGIETVRQIHTLQPHMYAVLVTAYQDRHVDAIHQIFGEEFQDRWDYLNKPFTEGEIIQKARSIVAMWNLRQRDKEQRSKLDQLKTKMLESEKSSAVAAVARNIGHEFGNILLQIMGRAELSLTTTPEEMKKGLESIITASEHASHLLSRFKELSSPTKEAAHFEPVSLKDIVDATLELMSHELHKRNIRPIVEVSENITIQAVRTSLIQVFMNLVINSSHAVGENGTISITAEPAPDKKHIEIHISDSGPGIPEDIIEKIFDTFFTTKGHQGSGLGLAICREIIEVIHSGEISVSNQTNKGADFKILLPIKSMQ